MQCSVNNINTLRTGQNWKDFSLLSFDKSIFVKMMDLEPDVRQVIQKYLWFTRPWRLNHTQIAHKSPPPPPCLGPLIRYNIELTVFYITNTWKFSCINLFTVIFKIFLGIVEGHFLLISCLYSRFNKLSKFALYFFSQRFILIGNISYHAPFSVILHKPLINSPFVSWLIIIGDYDINDNVFCIDHVIVKRITAAWETSLPISPIFQLSVANGYAHCLKHLDALLMEVGPLFDQVVESVEWY